MDDLEGSFDQINYFRRDRNRQNAIPHASREIVRNSFLQFLRSRFGRNVREFFYPQISVTRLGDLMDFGQLFKAFGNN